MKKMIQFEAIYDTEYLKGIKYGFKAPSMEDALEYCKQSFNVEDIYLTWEDENGNESGKWIKNVR